jgi:UDP-GlcNAc:undecaprenyl-phosphate/decaprenyl-phosphate GlcNAc-1-phosphate transferase
VRVTAFVGSGLLGGIVTVIWIVAITNAFNMLDNMDGLSAGVAAIAGIILGIVAIQSGQFFIAAILAPLVGALLGFLVFNYPPASIYMGDAGSLFIGFILSVISVLVTFNEGSGSFRPVVLPLLVFCVPIYDVFSVILLRLREGRRPWHGDRRHFSHRLVALGLSDRIAVLAIHLLTLGIGLSAILLYLIRDPVVELITILQALVILGVIVILEHTRPNSSP